MKSTKPQNAATPAPSHSDAERIELERSLTDARDAAVASEKLMSDLLQDGELLDEHHSMVETIRDRAEALLHLVGEILDFSRLPSTEGSLDVQRFELRPMLDDVMADFTRAASDKGILLEIEVAPGLAECYEGDEARLRPSHSHTLDNAVKFTDEGRVTLRVRPSDRDEALQFDVEDTGVGIPETGLAQLFDPFCKGEERKNARRPRGLGLGLTIARRLVEMLGGSIEAKSRPEGGTWVGFTVRLLPS